MENPKQPEEEIRRLKTKFDKLNLVIRYKKESPETQKLKIMKGFLKVHIENLERKKNTNEEFSEN